MAGVLPFGACRQHKSEPFPAGKPGQEAEVNKNGMKNQKEEAMKNETKQKYEAPRIEVIKMESEGLMVGSGSSGNLPGVPSGDAFSTPQAYRTSRYSSDVSLGEVEDMINDLLTVPE